MKLIASWGTSDSGKTTTALAVAAELVRRKREVLVIGADTAVPMLPIYLPNSKTERKNSMGAIFEQEIKEGALKDKLLPHPKSDKLYFMGLASGELNGITYKIPDRAAITALLDILRHAPFDFVMIDCDSNPVFDPITLLALELADTVLRSVTPDVRGYEAITAQLKWLSNSDNTFRVERHLKIYAPAYPLSPLAEMEALAGKADYILPYAWQVAEWQMAGQLLHGFDGQDGVRYEREIEKIVDRIEGDMNG